MSLLDELENMSITAAYDDPKENENISSYDPTQGIVRMWQERFGYTYEQAAELIQITRTFKKPTTIQAVLSPAQARTIFVLKLDGPISTPQKVQTVANLSMIPELYYSNDEEGDARFCTVDGRGKVAIENWLSMQKEIGFRPLFIPEGRAYKELSSHSIYPTLGKDVTLPQYRPQDLHLLDAPSSFSPTQDQFPVWYFFYGTLASVPKLCSLLPLLEGDIPVLHEASVVGGEMETWGNGKYNALVDGSRTSCIKGSAYQVISEEYEDALRKYETSAYEVVRCLIEMGGEIVKGCTFRFVGEID